LIFSAINLNPVSTLTVSTPDFSAITAGISLETMDFKITPLSGNESCFS
jgi:hypothetical protein